MDAVCVEKPRVLDNYEIINRNELSDKTDFDTLISRENLTWGTIPVENITTNIYLIKHNLPYRVLFINSLLSEKKDPLQEETRTQPIMLQTQLEDKFFELSLKLQVQSFQLKGRINSALNLLFRTLEDELIKKNYSKCDRFLNSINVNEFDIKLLIGILTITYPWKKELTYREGFYVETSNYIHQIFPKDEARSILLGLN